MGSNTVIVVLNDHLSEIEQDPEFGKRLAEAIRSHDNHGDPPYVTGHTQVIGVGDAEYVQVIAVGGNTGHLIGWARRGQTDDQIIAELVRQRRVKPERQYRPRRQYRPQPLLLVEYRDGDGREGRHLCSSREEAREKALKFLSSCEIEDIAEDFGDYADWTANCIWYATLKDIGGSVTILEIMVDDGLVGDADYPCKPTEFNSRSRPFGRQS